MAAHVRLDNERVLKHIVHDTCGNGVNVHLECGKVKSGGKYMIVVRFARLSQLSFVGFFSKETCSFNKMFAILTQVR